MDAITDFKSISQKLNRLEQRTDWHEKNPPKEPEVTQPIWHPQYGYGMAPAAPLVISDPLDVLNLIARPYWWGHINTKI